jgi:hypothetical protein
MPGTIFAGSDGHESPEQTRFVQMSFAVAGLPSSHALPFGCGAYEHVAVSLSQTPAAWHGAGGAQVMVAQRSMHVVPSELSV